MPRESDKDRAIAAKKARGEQILSEDEMRQAAEQKQAAQQAQKLQRLVGKLQDASVPVPADLTPQTLSQDTELRGEDWASAQQSMFAADPAMKRKMLRVIFLRGLDKFNSFNMQYVQTRLNLMAMRFSGSAPSAVEQAYLDAVSEGSLTPTDFHRREHYIRLWHEGQATLPKWTSPQVKRFNQTLARMREKASIIDIAQQALAMMASQEAETAADQLASVFERSMAGMQQEFAMASMEKRLEMVDLLDGKAGATGMHGMLGHS